MRIAVFGGEQDPITQVQLETIARHGDEAILIEFSALERGVPVSSMDGGHVYDGRYVGDLDGAILRYIPRASAPYMRADENLTLYEDWYAAYMHAVEKSSFYMSWLLELAGAGVPLVNPPHAASVHQFKPFQIEALRRAGARVPRQLVSNDPVAVRAFAAEVGEVIFKPVVGGALARLLDAEALQELELIRASPVIFQERVPGEDIRVTMVGDRVISAVAIETPEGTVDFRNDPSYREQGGTYREVEIPERVLDQCRRAMRECSLEFSGIDLRQSGDDWAFIELNSSPVYLEVEQKMGHPITQALVNYVRERAMARRSRRVRVAG